MTEQKRDTGSTAYTALSARAQKIWLTVEGVLVLEGFGAVLLPLFGVHSSLAPPIGLTAVFTAVVARAARMAKLGHYGIAWLLWGLGVVVIPAMSINRPVMGQALRDGQALPSPSVWSVVIILGIHFLPLTVGLSQLPRPNRASTHQAHRNDNAAGSDRPGRCVNEHREGAR